MYIIGVILLFILPLATGSACKGILRWKETNQIETYLIGFFFLFFMQGVIFVPCVFAGLPFSLACTMLAAVALGLTVLGFVMIFWNKFVSKKAGDLAEKKKLSWRKGDKLMYAVMMTVFVLLVVRMIMGLNLIRDDIILETVNTTLQTDTMFTYHPLTGMMMDGGMIASKKIVTLPLFYAAIAKLTGMVPYQLLYLVINIWVLICSYYACMLLFSKVTAITRSKIYIYWTVYGLLLLAGDYHASTLTYRLLYQGYEGTTICFGVLMPYLLYVILSWYRQESDEEKTTWGMRIMYVFKIALVFATSMVITGLGTGCLFLLATGGIAAVCCLLKSIQEVRACRE